ncbi:MAG: hypothetical protein R2706_08835 [Acidimicrobiales bacterium]
MRLTIVPGRWLPRRWRPATVDHECGGGDIETAPALHQEAIACKSIFCPKAASALPSSASGEPVVDGAVRTGLAPAVTGADKAAVATNARRRDASHDASRVTLATRRRHLGAVEAHCIVPQSAPTKSGQGKANVDKQAHLIAQVT